MVLFFNDASVSHASGIPLYHINTLCDDDLFLVKLRSPLVDKVIEPVRHVENATSSDEVIDELSDAESTFVDAVELLAE